MRLCGCFCKPQKINMGGVLCPRGYTPFSASPGRAKEFGLDRQGRPLGAVGRQATVLPPSMSMPLGWSRRRGEKSSARFHRGQIDRIEAGGELCALPSGFLPGYFTARIVEEKAPPRPSSDSPDLDETWQSVYRKQGRIRGPRNPWPVSSPEQGVQYLGGLIYRIQRGDISDHQSLP